MHIFGRLETPYNKGFLRMLWWLEDEIWSVTSSGLAMEARAQRACRAVEACCNDDAGSAVVSRSRR